MTQKPGSGSENRTRPTRVKKRHLTKADLDHFRKLLIEKYKQILGTVNEFEDEALRKPQADASGDLSSMPIHMADLGSDNFEQDFALGLVDSERKLLHEILAALDRIEQGTYGICEGTGKPIPKTRLEAQPWTRYCVEYARTLEQGRTPQQYEQEQLQEHDETEEQDQAGQ